jgi:hypothetical protein
VVNEKTDRKANSARVGLSRADAERLVSGGSGAGEDLRPFADTIEALRRVDELDPTEAEVQAFAALAAKSVPAVPARVASRADVAHAKPRRRMRLGLAVSSVALVVVLSGFGGLAYAANGAAPGDPLYGVDLALEKAGIGDGGLKERLTEAGLLVERGRVQEGLDHAGDSIAASAAGDGGLGSVAAALHAAAATAAESQSLQSPEGRALLAERLRQMASLAPTTQEFGQAAKDLAGSLSPSGQGGSGTDQNQAPSTDDPAAGSGTGQGSTGTTAPGGSGGGSGGGGNGNGSGSPK